jgi:hypothetical protein
LKGLEEMKDDLTSAIKKDLGKAPFVTELTSITPCVWDVKYNLKHIDKVSQ